MEKNLQKESSNGMIFMAISWINEKSWTFWNVTHMQTFFGQILCSIWEDMPVIDAFPFFSTTLHWHWNYAQIYCIYIFITEKWWCTSIWNIFFCILCGIYMVDWPIIRAQIFKIENFHENLILIENFRNFVHRKTNWKINIDLTLVQKVF